MKVKSTFPKAQRFPVNLIYSTNFTTAFLGGPQNKGPTFPRSQRTLFIRNSQTPGPGNYNLSEEKHAPVVIQHPYKVNKEFLDYMRSRPKSVQPHYPGPGAYQIPSTLRRRGVSFTRARGGSLLHENYPGPGEYTISRPISKMSHSRY